RPGWAEHWMAPLDDHLTRSDLWVREHLRVIVDGTAGYVICLELREPVVARPGSGDALDQLCERGAIPDAFGVVQEIGRLHPLGVAEQRAQATEQLVVGGAERDVPVRASNRLVRRTHPVRRSEWGGNAPAGEVLRGFPHRQRHA